MDALVPAFIIALLAEIGDATQLLAMLLGIRFGSKGAVIAGIAFAAIANMALGAAAGVAIALEINHRVIVLMTGIGLVFAGGGAALKVKAPDPVDGWRLGAFVSSALAFFILELFDKTQFVVATISAGTGQPVMTAIGAAAGVVVANAPAVVLGESWPKLAPVRVLRYVAGGLMVLAGLYLVIQALGLV